MGSVAPIVAVDAHLSALRTARFCYDKNLNDGRNAGLRTHWKDEVKCLTMAQPFIWSGDPVTACLEASKTIPGDTRLSKHNLRETSMWWYFSEPTIQVPVNSYSLEHRRPLIALSLTWVTLHLQNSFRVTLWTDNPDRHRSHLELLAPQTWFWDDDETLDGMIARSRNIGETVYKGKIAPEILEATMDITITVSRFVLAAMAWLEQKIVVEQTEQIQRQRRKEFTKTTRREFDGVRVVHLRKTERGPSEPGDGTRHLTCRFVVDPHWRNQVCGPKNGDRRLTYITSYVKGPDSAPFKVSSQKIYEVSR